MLWTPTKTYTEEHFELEADLERAIQEVKDQLFGPSSEHAWRLLGHTSPLIKEHVYRRRPEQIKRFTE